MSFSTPMLPSVSAMLDIAWPACVRTAHALSESPCAANSFGTLRILGPTTIGWRMPFTVPIEKTSSALVLRISSQALRRTAGSAEVSHSRR